MSKRSDRLADALERIRTGVAEQFDQNKIADALDHICTGDTEQFDQMGAGYIELDDDEGEGEK